MYLAWCVICMEIGNWWKARRILLRSDHTSVLTLSPTDFRTYFIRLINWQMGLGCNLKICSCACERCLVDVCSFEKVTTNLKKAKTCLLLFSVSRHVCLFNYISECWNFFTLLIVHKLFLSNQMFLMKLMFGGYSNSSRILYIVNHCSCFNISTRNFPTNTWSSTPKLFQDKELFKTNPIRFLQDIFFPAVKILACNFVSLLNILHLECIYSNVSSFQALIFELHELSSPITTSTSMSKVWHQNCFLVTLERIFLGWFLSCEGVHIQL